MFGHTGYFIFVVFKLDVGNHLLLFSDAFLQPSSPSFYCRTILVDEFASQIRSGVIVCEIALSIILNDGADPADPVFHLRS